MIVKSSDLQACVSCGSPHLKRLWSRSVDFLIFCEFLAHLWGAYAIPLLLSVVCRESFVVCRLCPP